MSNLLAVENKKALALSLGFGFVAYQTYRYFRTWNNKDHEFVPIGVIKELYIHPVKSWSGKSVFSLYCDKMGVVCGSLRDRYFQVVDGNTGLFYTARQKPKMVLIEADIKDNLLIVSLPDGKTSYIDLNEVKKNKKIIRTTLFDKKKQDGYDCGDEISKLLSEFIDEPNTRLVAYDDHLYSERTMISKKEWWMNNPVPNRKDEVAYVDFAPYLIMTEGSLNDLNTRLEEKVTHQRFRPNIVIDKCPAYDEDKWAELKIGDVRLECFCPCTRCVLTTVDPETGIRDKENQPLKTLRSYRISPEGCMRKEFKDDPIFGVNAGLVKPGFIHIGQVVYARYKKSVF
ncbi:unnamed protein product [Auanema sp. JU1783]|nr:unnamed protein product [Auanema sp. JU1783]